MIKPKQPTAEKLVLIVADSFGSLDVPNDSSLHLIDVAAQKHGFRALWTTASKVFARDGSLFARIDGEIVSGRLEAKPSAETSEGTIHNLANMHSVHWRADPPVDLETMRLWSLLAAFPTVRVLNSPHSLLTWNEKFAALRFGDWALGGLVSADEQEWKAFYEHCHVQGTRARVIVKPSGDAASRGVQFLADGWDAALEQLQKLRSQQGSWLVLQQYDPAIETEGETRIFVVDGQIAGAICKAPRPNHPIMNLDAAPSERPELTACTPHPEQLRRAEAVAARLKADGVVLATIDFIANRILEINVTSPGLIRWLDARLPSGEKIAERYWRAVQ